jgi:hypothetical protein
MKKAILFLFVMSIFFQCKENNDTDSPVLSPFEIEVSDSFYTNESSLTETGSVYLTDKDGAQVASANLTNNADVELNADFDNTDNRVDASFVLEQQSNTSGNRTYTVKTFVDVDPANISLQGQQQTSGGIGKVVIQNTGGDLDDVFFNIGGFGGFNGSWSASTGSAEYNYILNSTLDNALMTFRNNNENFKRYLWLEGVTANSVDTFNHDDIPILESVTRNYPDNENIRVDIYATLANEPNTPYYIYSHTDNDGAASNDLGFPEGIFERFQVYTTLIKDNKRYWTEKSSNTIDANYLLPNLDFQVSGSSVDDLLVTTSSDYDYYSVAFYANNLAEGYQVRWEVTGKSQSSIQVALPNLISEIFVDHPNFSMSDLVFTTASISQVQGISIYGDYITVIIDPFSNERKSIIASNSVSNQ